MAKVVEVKQRAGCVHCFEQAKHCLCGLSPDIHDTVSFRLGVSRGIEVLRSLSMFVRKAEAGHIHDELPRCAFYTSQYYKTKM